MKRRKSKGDLMNLRYAPSRIISRMTGRFCDLPLPPYFRVCMYQAYSAVLGVDLTELPAGTNLNDYRCFNDFFTREIDLSKRPIHLPKSKETICSPADGRILSFGELKTPANTVQCVKGADYPLAEFLFGVSGPNDKKMARFCESVHKRGNKLCYCVIYLSPSDYHRFHSPAHARFSNRRHIAGYLESVSPRYMHYRKEVLKNNERVNLLGVWQNGFFALSFIGAMNVGSVVLNFDDDLVTN